MISLFLNLRVGIQRLLIVGTLVGSPIIGWILAKLFYRTKIEIVLGFTLKAGILIYWLAIFIILWILEGFQKDKNL